VEKNKNDNVVTLVMQGFGVAEVEFFCDESCSLAR